MKAMSAAVVSLNGVAVALLTTLALMLAIPNLFSPPRAVDFVLCVVLAVPYVAVIVAVLKPHKSRFAIVALVGNAVLAALLGVAAAVAVTGLAGASGLLTVIGPSLSLSVFNLFTLTLAWQRRRQCAHGS